MSLFGWNLKSQYYREGARLLSIMKEYGSLNIIQCTSVNSINNLKAILGLKKIVLVPGVMQSQRDYLNRNGWVVYDIFELPPEIDGIIISDVKMFREIYRKLDILFRKDFLILPLRAEWVVSNAIKRGSPSYLAWNSADFVNYIARSSLTGHYLEFGTYWGSSFFRNYFLTRHWLMGNFYAFDSFLGLPNPAPLEAVFTGHDFKLGAYCSNEKSFLALSDFLDVDKSRIKLIPGYYERTLKTPEDYDFSPNSVSVCYIDCDLMESTEQVLEFITPILEPGALLYFDDWRLCRASPLCGERAAALNWLKRYSNFELIELSRDSWQDQWFIFQKI